MAARPDTRAHLYRPAPPGGARWRDDGLALAVIVGISWFLANYSPNLHDPDSLYHLRHAAIYWARGIGYAEFPWVQFSVVRTIGADLWYGFHLLLVPLTAFADPVVGVRVGDNLAAILSLGLYYAALRRLHVRWPVVWALVFVFLTGDVAYRLPVLRPHPLSLTLSFLLFAVVAGPRPPDSSLQREAGSMAGDVPGRVRFAATVCVLAAAIAWLHLLLAWVPVVVLVIVEAVRFVRVRRIDGATVVGVGTGLLLGWILRPNPFGAARLAYLVLVRMPIAKQSGVPLNVGTELKPFGWGDFTEQLVPLAILLMAGVGLLLWMRAGRKGQASGPATTRDDEVPVWSSLILALGFGVMAFTVARRSNEFLVGFGVLFVGQVWTGLLGQPLAVRRRVARHWSARVLAAVVVGALGYGAIQSLRLYDYYMKVSVPRDELKDVALWLQQHTEPGSLVFNVHWDRFGNLFGWNDHNRYINGMDPIFEYAFDPALYWKNHFYAVGQAGAFTCGAQQCSSAESVPTYPVLSRDFGASYVVVESWRSPKLFAYLKGAPGFEKVFETPRAAVFKIRS